MTQHTSTNSNDLPSRYLDGDLPAEEAVRFAAQVAHDPQLQKELSDLKAARTAVRRYTPTPSGTDSETMRLRAFARFRANAETETWQATPKTTRRIATSVWRPALVTALGVFVVVGAYLIPSPVSQPQQGVVSSTTQQEVPLPGDREMSLLFDLHDAHGAPLSTDDAALQRHHTARAQADLLDYADATVAETL